MYRIMRYPDARIALRVGNDLDLNFVRDWLTGLNFIVEPGGSVIIVAFWNDAKPKPSEFLLDELFKPGEPVDADPDELITAQKLDHIYFLGDGLEPFKLYVLNRYPQGEG